MGNFFRDVSGRGRYSPLVCADRRPDAELGLGGKHDLPAGMAGLLGEANHIGSDNSGPSQNCI